MLLTLTLISMEMGLHRAGFFYDPQVQVGDVGKPPGRALRRHGIYRAGGYASGHRIPEPGSFAPGLRGISRRGPVEFLRGLQPLADSQALDRRL